MTERRAVLVTGGAGFVGATLVRDLLDDGVRVAVYDNWANSSPDRLPSAHSQLELFTGDVRDEDEIRETLERFQPDVLIHLAALHFIPYCNAHPDECWDVNTVGTLRLMAAMRGSSVARVVVASTAAVYPIQDAACREDGLSGPIDIYGASKQACEALANRLAVEEGIPVAAARLFNVFGPGETNPHVIPEIIAQVRADQPLKLGNLDAKRDYVHVRDVSRALRALASTDLQGFAVYNVGSGTAWSVADILHILGEGRLGGLKVTRDEERMRAVDRPVLLADASRMAAEFGWKAEVDLRTGLLELLEEAPLGR